MSAFTVTPPARTTGSNKLQDLVKTAAATEPSVFHDSVSAAVRGLRLRLKKTTEKAYPDLAELFTSCLIKKKCGRAAFSLSPSAVSRLGRGSHREAESSISTE
jgi:hypothetical protein